MHQKPRPCAGVFYCLPGPEGLSLHARHFDAVLMHPPIQRRPRYPQRPRRIGRFPAMADQCIQQQLPGRARHAAFRRSNRFTAHLLRQVLQLHLPAFTHRAGIAQHLPQLAQVSRPTVNQQCLQRIIGQHHLDSTRIGLLGQQLMNQPQPILTFPQRPTVVRVRSSSCTKTAASTSSR